MRAPDAKTDNTRNAKRLFFRSLGRREGGGLGGRKARRSMRRLAEAVARLRRSGARSGQVATAPQHSPPLTLGPPAPPGPLDGAAAAAATAAASVAGRAWAGKLDGRPSAPWPPPDTACAARGVPAASCPPSPIICLLALLPALVPLVSVGFSFSFSTLSIPLMGTPETRVDDGGGRCRRSFCS